MKIKINKNEVLNFSIQGGKMECVPSLSTDKYTNENCIRLTKHKGNTICKKCFVDRTIEYREDLKPCLENNSRILTQRLLNDSEISKLKKILGNLQIFRFEAFGDLNNVIQLMNYINIAKAYPRTKFSLFTKFYSIVIKYFKSGKRLPKNMTLVLSAPFENEPLNNDFMNMFKKYHKRTIMFMVTNDKNNLNINCGKRKCIECRNCYDAPKPHNVVELEK